jgi:hypothetical protein
MALPKPAGEFGHLLAAEEDQDHHEDEQELRAPERVEEGEQGVRLGHGKCHGASFQKARFPQPYLTATLTVKVSRLPRGTR